MATPTKLEDLLRRTLRTLPPKGAKHDFTFTNAEWMKFPASTKRDVLVALALGHNPMRVKVSLDGGLVYFSQAYAHCLLIPERTPLAKFSEAEAWRGGYFAQGFAWNPTEDPDIYLPILAGLKMLSLYKGEDGASDPDYRVRAWYQIPYHKIVTSWEVTGERLGEVISTLVVEMDLLGHLQDLKFRGVLC